MSPFEIFNFLCKLLAGTGVFLIGVHLLTTNMEQLATSKIRNLFNKTADKKIINVGIGGLTTAIIQSSGVTTVLIVGFVNVGIMSLSQATAMIMGANIGTTITAQIAALSTFDIDVYVHLLTFIGIFAAMLSKKDGVKKLGMLVAGLGLVFVGLTLMADSMKESRDGIQKIFEIITNPFLLFFMGIVITALVQSSSATTSIVIAMSVAGLKVGTGGNEVLYIILGTNIGSCVTAIMSTIGASAGAKRAGLIHLMFNTFGSVIFFVILYCCPTFMEVTFARWFPHAATQIAMFHTFFNVVCTLIFLPCSEWFVKIAKLIVKDERKRAVSTYLEERMISSPSIAIQQILRESFLLADTAMDAFRTAYRAFEEKDDQPLADVYAKIDRANDMSQAIIAYMVKVSAHCSVSEEKKVSAVHNSLGDIMRIAEIADNFTKYTKREIEKNLDFSDLVKTELNDMISKVEGQYALTKEIILRGERKLLAEVDRVEEEIDDCRKRLIDNHIERLNKGLCKAESNSVFINLVSNIERLGDHISYIAHMEQ